MKVETEEQSRETIFPLNEMEAAVSPHLCRQDMTPAVVSGHPLSPGRGQSMLPHPHRCYHTCPFCQDPRGTVSSAPATSVSLQSDVKGRRKESGEAFLSLLQKGASSCLPRTKVTVKPSLKPACKSSCWPRPGAPSARLPLTSRLPHHLPNTLQVVVRVFWAQRGLKKWKLCAQDTLNQVPI